MRILMHMPTKNVYVAETDVPLFEHAAALAGSMSTAVVAGLRLYVAAQERSRRGSEMHEIEVDVEEAGLVTTKRFSGRLLARFEERTDRRVAVHRVYATARGQFAVHSRDDPDWAGFTAAPAHDPDAVDAQEAADSAAWNGDWWRRGPRTLTVYPDIASMRERLPGELVDAIAQASERPAVEELDI